MAKNLVTENEIRRRFPNASAATIARNLSAVSQGPGPVVECAAGYEPLAKAQPQALYSGIVLVRITSFRRRLLDEDNLAEKYHLDCCRYAGLISSDAPDKTHIEVRQVKVKDKDAERTEIEIIPL